MKHACCGKPLTKWVTHRDAHGRTLAHVWKCYECKTRYKQRVRQPKTPKSSTP